MLLSESIFSRNFLWFCSLLFMMLSRLREACQLEGFPYECVLLGRERFQLGGAADNLNLVAILGVVMAQPQMHGLELFVPDKGYELRFAHVGYERFSFGLRLIRRLAKLLVLVPPA